MPTLTCPSCQRYALEPTHLQNVEIDICTHCGGMWFDDTELEEVVRHYDPEYPKDKPIVEEMGVCLKKSRWVCPACQAGLDSYEFESGSELQIDICEKCHGIWLEKGELSHAEAYYEIPEAMARINQKRSVKHWFFQFLLQLPVEFNLKPRRLPVVTLSLILLNVLFFLITFSDAIPLHFYSTLALVPATFGTTEWWSALITYQFLHGGFVHLAGNMYFLYILGDNLEDALGRYAFLAFYLACGVAGGVAQTLLSLDSQIPVVGASGAIAGVIAGYAYTFRKAKLTFLFFFFQWKIPVSGYIGIWLAINLFGVLVDTPNVAWYAHLGGFAAGLGITALRYPAIIQDNPLISYLNHTAVFEVQQPVTQESPDREAKYPLNYT